jgi:hypothetical protein
MTPFVDGFTTTSPPGDLAALSASVGPLLTAAGGVTQDGRLWRFTGALGRRGGVGYVHLFRGVARVHLSGQALGHVRAVGLYLDLLHALAEQPHRVTLVDIARDDAVTDAGPYLDHLYATAKAGGVRLSRKRVDPDAVTQLRAPSLYGGADTGTVYLGSRDRHEISGRVYDKRQERLKYGFPDPGPLLRIEVTARSQVRATLRDLADPVPLFYHLASPALCTRPDGVADWQPFGEGFTLPEREPTLPAVMLQRLVDAGAGDALCKLAALCGTAGDEYLHRLLRRRMAVLAQPSEASALVRADTSATPAAA